METPVKKSTLLFASLVMTFAPGLQAADRAWPVRPIKLVVPYPAGGGGDLVARRLADFMGNKLGQAVVVENKGGAIGTIGASMVAHAEPDGYTLLLNGAGPGVTASFTQADLPYDAAKDLTPIVLLGLQPNLLAIPANAPYTDLPSFIAAAKARPGQVSYASSGVGAMGHLAAEMFQQTTKTSMNHIPFRGSGPAAAALISGHVDSAFDTIAAYVPHIRAGKLRALLVTSRERLPALPEVPTTSEVGLPNFETANWYGLSGPANLPRNIVDKVNAVANEYLNLPDSDRQFNEMTIIKRGGTPEAFAEFLKSEAVKWEPVIRSAGITTK